MVAFSRVEVLLARGLQLREHELRLLVGELRLLVEQLRAIAVDLRLVDRRIDLGEQLSLLDDGADVHEQRLHLPGHLRADVDEVLGLERPGRGDRVFEVAALSDRRDQRGTIGVRAEPRLPRVVTAGTQQRARSDSERNSAEPAWWNLGFFFGRHVSGRGTLLTRA